MIAVPRKRSQFLPKNKFEMYQNFLCQTEKQKMQGNKNDKHTGKHEEHVRFFVLHN